MRTMIDLGGPMYRFRNGLLLSTLITKPFGYSGKGAARNTVDVNPDAR